VSLTIDLLRTEHLIDPIGIGVTRPRVSWRRHATTNGETQSAYAIQVASAPELLTAGTPDVWDSGQVAGPECALVELGGPDLRSRERRWWRVQVWDGEGRPSGWSEPAFFEAGMLATSDWQAKWIGATPAAFERDGYRPVPLLRRGFEVEGGVVTARLYVTALGVYRAFVNGTRVGSDELRPGWTDYTQRIQYQAYDVTEQLTSGSNCIGIELGEGWYSGHLGVMCTRETYGRDPRALAQLEIETADGQRAVITSDGTWRTAYGPTLRSDLLLGEIYDARQARPGWAGCAYDDSEWDAVVVDEPGSPASDAARVPTYLPGTDAPASAGSAAAAVAAAVAVIPGYERLVASRSEPVRVVRELVAQSVSSPVFQTFIFDFGQNLVGWTRLTVDVPPGTEVVVRHGEALNADGTLYTANLRLAEQTERYIAGVEGPETFEPAFTFHGFRYAEVVVNLPELPAEAVTALVAHSDMRQVGSFACSSPMLNQLQSNIEWGQRGNFLEVPTDCPQRNERLGWLGDARIFSRTALFNFDAAAFLGKWLEDVRLARTPDGVFPDFAPWVGPFFMDGAPGWSDAGVFVPWNVFEWSGDTRLLAECYPAMAQFVELLHKENPSLIRRTRRGIDWGDWLSMPEADPEQGRGSGPIIDSVHSTTNKDVFATAFFAQSASLVARAAVVLGHAEDARRFGDLARDIRAAFVAEFVDADGRIDSDTQTAYALALCFDLLPVDLMARAGEHLAAAVDRHGGRLSTGIAGTELLLPALVKAGRGDLAYGILLSEEYPSWGHSIRHGATTIWERWDGWTEERGFQDIRMNSLNHYALGAVGDFLYTQVAGLRCAGPGWTSATITPQPGAGLTWAEARYDSPQGEYAVKWEQVGDKLAVSVTVPVSCEATVQLPTGQRLSFGSGQHEVIA
jgi:alpha-L-rhamnosidase